MIIFKLKYLNNYSNNNYLTIYLVIFKKSMPDSTGVLLQPVVWFGLVWLDGDSNLLWLCNLGLLAVVGV